MEDMSETNGEYHLFSVRPCGVNGIGGSTALFEAYVVRNPDMPNVTYSYDSGTSKITIAEG
jgi:hypothetical protein